MITTMEGTINLTVASYNCRCFNNLKSSYIEHLLSSASILFIQEHWLSVEQLTVFSQFRDFQYVGVSGFDSSTFLPGRPYGGVAILWRSDLMAHASVLSVSSKRICCLRLVLDTYRLLSMYMLIVAHRFGHILQIVECSRIGYSDLLSIKKPSFDS